MCKLAVRHNTSYYADLFHLNMRRYDMTSAATAEAHEKIKKAQENIAVVIGTFFTLILCFYFFTYAMLVDKGLYGLLWAQGISALAMLLMLIRLKSVSFFITRLWLGRKVELQDAFSEIKAGGQ